MKKIKNIFTLGLLFCLFLNLTLTAFAEEEIATYTEYEDSENESTFTIYPRIRGTYFLNGSGSIAQSLTGYVVYQASTTGQTYLPYIKVAVTLLTYSDGVWYVVDYDSATRYNDYYVAVSKMKYVGSDGAYYRIYTEHNANGETLSAFSNAIWIS